MTYFLEPHPILDHFTQTAKASPLMARFIQVAKPLKEKGEISPGATVPVTCMNRQKEAKIFPMSWGFHFDPVPGKTPGAFVSEADALKAAEKESTRELYRSHRCIIPASYIVRASLIPLPNGSYQTGDRYVVQPTGEDVCYLAGIYRLEKDLPVFLLLTQKDSNEYGIPTLPVFIPQAYVRKWISPEEEPDYFVNHSLNSFVFEKVTMP
ncbi:MAG: SOS response-associated peptidase family protein [Clostridia bacterium]|nr:SOS response-associated peptidase family protein [Clostridia bacterium]